MPDCDRSQPELPDPVGEDADVHLALIELHVQALRGQYDGRCIVAPRLYTADIDDLQEIDRDDLAPGNDHQRLTWALTTLGHTSLAEERPRWWLGLGLQTSDLPFDTAS